MSLGVLLRESPEAVQVAVSDTATAATSITYTVPAGKEFFMTSWTLAFTSTGTDKVALTVRNAADVDQYTIQKLGAETTLLESQGDSGNFIPPLRIPAGWDVILVAGTDIDGTCFIHGFTENA